MATARHGDERYSVDLAETAEARAAVYALRESVYAAGQPYLLAPRDSDVCHRAADAFDARSFVFACHHDGDSTPVATCRFTTPLGGRWELDDLASEWTAPPVPAHLLVETSRVVVRPDARATGLVDVMLLLAGSWLLRETAYRYNFAVCAPPLVRLYARLGMTPTSATELRLRGRPHDRTYVVIYGDMKASQPAVTARLTNGGWDISPDAAPRRRAGT